MRSARVLGATAAVSLLIAGASALTAAGLRVHNILVVAQLPFDDPRSLLFIAGTNRSLGVTEGPMSLLDIEDLARADSIADIAAFTTANRPVKAGPERSIWICQVSENFFDVIGYSPAVGQLRLPPTGRRDERNAVLSYRLSQRQFGGSAEAIGKTLHSDVGRLHVIGVLPAGLGFPAGVDVWLSLNDRAIAARREARMWQAVGRIAPGWTPNMAANELTLAAARLEQAFPASNRDSGVFVETLADRIIGAGRRQGIAVLGAVSLLLAVMITLDVATLRLVGLLRLRDDLLTRAMLGAGRRHFLRLAAQRFLGLVAGAVPFAIVVVTFLVAGLRALLPPTLKGIDQLQVDPALILQTLLLTGFAALVADMIAWGARRVLDGPVAPGRRCSSKGLAGLNRWSRVLVVSHAAVAVICSVSALLFVRTALALRQTDLGFSTDRVIAVPIRPTAGSAPSQGAQVRGLLAELARLPIIEAAGGITSAPLGSAYSRHTVSAGDRPAVRIGVELQYVTPGYFRTIGTPLLRGVDFDHAHHSAVLINRACERQLFPGGVNQSSRVVIRGQQFRVIGVIRDAHYRGPRLAAVPEVYLNYMEDPQGRLAILARSRVHVEPHALLESLRRIAPTASIGEPYTLASRFDEQIRNEHALATLLSLAGLAAVLLTGAATFATVAAIVVSRRHEFAIRTALGATPAQLRGALSLSIASLVALGTVLAAVSWSTASVLIEKLLFRVGPGDLLSWVLAVTAVFAAGVGATLLPFGRAVLVEPDAVLKHVGRAI